jgi:hypothetical protein
MIALAACAYFSSAQKQELAQCEEAALAKAAQQLEPSVYVALAGESQSWEADLDALIISQGQAAICAVPILIARLEQSAAGGSTTDTVLLTRAQAYRVKRAQPVPNAPRWVPSVSQGDGGP